MNEIPVLARSNYPGLEFLQIGFRTHLLIDQREEQIVATREKSQWIVLQEYSHTYNTRIQLSRLQRIYRNSIATYDQFKIFNDNEPVKSGEPISFHVDAVTVGSIA
jgi:hypothetical protein